MPKTTKQPEQEQAEEPRQPLEAFVYHQRRAYEEMGKAIDALLPEGFKEHGAQARREFLTSFKVLVDAAITELERISKKAEEAGAGGERPASTGKTKVKVQVE
jgi:hypothetical protein